MPTLKEGALAPDFDLPTGDGGHVHLADLRGKTVVVYFYPKDDTQGCTLEALNFTAAKEDFSAAGAEIIGISPNTPKSHEKFTAKHKLGVTLAADVEHSAIDRYGVWIEKSMYGRKYMGVERATFLVGPDGRIRHIWHNVRVKGHVEQVLAAVKAL